MSNTIFISAPVGIWTEVASSGSGFLTNESDNIIYYREANILPDQSVKNGHILQRRSSVRYQLNLGFKVFVLSIFESLSKTDQPAIAITPD